MSLDKLSSAVVKANEALQVIEKATNGFESAENLEFFDTKKLCERILAVAQEIKVLQGERIAAKGKPGRKPAPKAPAAPAPAAPRQQAAPEPTAAEAASEALGAPVVKTSAKQQNPAVARAKEESKPRGAGKPVANPLTSGPAAHSTGPLQGQPELTEEQAALFS